jgi:peptidoglycan/LPS O-acetylase OafA/YrhL
LLSWLSRSGHRLRSDATERIPQLDGIRGIAISLVVLFHYFGGNAEDSIIGNKVIRFLFNRGLSGVDLFFILSGFLIGGILLDNKINARFLRVFYYRRSLRIFPLYYIFLTCAFLVLGVPEDWWAYLSYVQNITMALGIQPKQSLSLTWSLAVEEHFYLLLPFMIATLSRRSLLVAVGIVVIVAQALRIVSVVVLPYPETNFGYYFTLCRIDELMLGVGAALAVRTPDIFRWVKNSPSKLCAVMAVCLLALPPIQWCENKYPGFYIMFGIPVYAVMYLAFLLLVVSRPSSLAGKLTNLSLLRWIGLRAYSIYLFHPIVSEIICSNLQGASLASAYIARFLAIACTVSVAALTWRLIEQPLIRRGHRFSYRAAAPVREATEDGIAAPQRVLS